MKITQITVTAGRVIPHPTTAYANLRPSVTFTATVEEGEDPLMVTRKLQKIAEHTIEEHKAALLSGVVEIEEMAAEEGEIGKLERTIENAQTTLEQLPELRTERSRKLINQPAVDDEEMPF